MGAFEEYSFLNQTSSVHALCISKSYGEYYHCYYAVDQHYFYTLNLLFDTTFSVEGNPSIVQYWLYTALCNDTKTGYPIGKA